MSKFARALCRGAGVVWAAFIVMLLSAGAAHATVASSTTLSPSASSTAFGQPVTFTATVTGTGGTPTGTVTFFDGGTQIGSPVPLNGSGQANFTTSAFTTGTHTITASYSGDSTFGSSNSNSLLQLVEKANTTTTLTPSANPIVFGQSVNLTAIVSPNAPGAGGPTGTVNFFVDSVLVSSATVNAGTGIANFTASGLSAGTHTIQATYTGDTNFNTSTSSPLIEAVGQDSTATTVSGAPNPSNFGQAVTFTATVVANAPGSGTPTGNVTFIDTTTNVILGVPQVIGAGMATLTTSALTPGSHTISAVYSGDTNFTGSTSAPTSQVVNGVATHFSVSALGTATSGVTFNFIVTALDAFNNAVTGYTGTVHFTSTDGAAILPANSTLTNGVGTFSATLNTAGPRAITATDTATPGITGTSGTIVVSAGAATHFSVSAPGTATSGVAFNFTVTALNASNNVVPSYTGTVHFTSTDGSATLPADATLTNGVGTFTATLQTAGPRTIIATDTVTGSITGTSGAIVVSAGAATHFSVSAPGTATHGVAFNFTVNALDAFNNAATGYTGTVHFTSSDGAAVLPVNSTLTNGVGTFSATLNTNGPQTITATDTVNAAITATSGTIAVNAPPVVSTATTLASSQNPSVHNQPVTFTATVTANTGTPTGTVTFLDSGQAIGTGTLAAGVATFTTATLTIGTHSITASYAGVPGFLASTSTALSQAVNVPLDSLKLRAMQVEATQIAAQISGDAFSEAIDAAIAEGFSDNPSFATPSANGMHVNLDGQLAAGQQLSDADANAPDPALGRAMVLSDNGLKPAMGTFASLSASANGPRDQPPGAGPGKPGQTDPNQVASLAPAKTQTAAAPTMVGPTPTAWQAWADVRGSGWDNSGSAGDIHGTQVNTLAGLTRRLAPDFLVGALAGYEHFNYSSQLLNGRLQGDGWTVGGYLGWKLDPQLRFDAALAHSGVSYNDVAGTASGSFPGSRWLASAGLTGTYKLMPFEIEPSAKVFALWEHEDPYTDSLGTPQAAFHFTTGRASTGFKLSYPMPWTPTTGLTPYVGIYGDYYFSSNNSNSVLVPSTFIRGGAGRVTAGITARLDSGVKLALGGEYGGLGNNFQNWTVMGRVSVPLSTLFGEPAPMAAALAPAKAATAAPTRQMASLQPAADTTVAPVAQSADVQIPPERIVVRFSKHALFLTAEGRSAFDEAVVDLLAGKPVQVAIDGCGAGADFAEGSLCARRQASLQQLLAERGVSETSRLLSEMR